MRGLVLLASILTAVSAHDIACDADSRPRVINADDGQITSPGYPGENYPDNSECHWHFVGSNQDDTMTITFLDVNLEVCADCSCDAIDIYDGDSTDAPLIRSVCENTEDVIASTGNEMYLVFRSNEENSAPGFVANFLLMDTACSPNRPLVLPADMGNIHSQYYPARHPHNQDCSWRILGEGSQVRLTFLDFDLQNDFLGFCLDYVEILDSNEDGTDTELIGEYCGEDIPESVSSTRGNIIVNFITDDSIAWRGFYLNFNKLEASDLQACTASRPLQLSGVAGAISSPGYPARDYPILSNCAWHIRADDTGSEGLAMLVNFADVEECEDCSCDFIEIYDGDSEDAPLLRRMCRRSLQPIHASDHDLYVVFRSNLEETGPGFSATWTTYEANDVACNPQSRPHEITDESGSFTSPNYPLEYEFNIECHWLVKGQGSDVTIDFEDFSVGTSSSCFLDFVEVFDVNDDNTDQAKLGTYCGRQLPESHTSTRGNLRVELHTWDSTERGFRATHRLAEP